MNDDLKRGELVLLDLWYIITDGVYWEKIRNIDKYIFKCSCRIIVVSLNLEWLLNNLNRVSLGMECAKDSFIKLGVCLPTPQNSS